VKPGIVIIGGGIAGLGAANLLVRKNFAVTVLEAKNRLGGRIHTIHEGRLPIELGAEFLHGENKAVRALVNAARLTTTEVPGSQLLIENGKLKRVDIWSKMAKILDSIDPRRPDCSFKDFIATKKLSPRDRAMAISFVQGFHAAYIDRIGVHSLVRGEYAAEQMEGDTQGRVDQGYSALVAYLEKQILARGGKILTNATVKNISWKQHRVKIEFRHNGKPRKLAAKSALITLPLGVLKSKTVKFIPPLLEKQEAIEQLQFANVIKIILVFREQWWPKKLSFVQSLDEKIPTWWTDSRGTVLTGWVGGPKADALKKYSALKLEQLSLKILGRMFPKAKGLHKKLITSHSYNWAQDPHVRGAYSYIPVNGLDLPKLLAAPVHNTLFFAGEATTTDAQTGTVFSAYESGLRAARECLASHADL
jgi:monoamine oxidase